MKKIFTIIAFSLLVHSVFSQEVLRVQNGGSITIQNGVNLILQGGIALANGSSLQNNGMLFLKNNSASNISDWTDNSASGALSGIGIVVFNSDHSQQFTGLTNFYTLAINTDQLTLNNNLNIANILRLVNGKINTGTFYVFLNNNLAAALETDAANSSYANSWINGMFRRLITSNTSTYDFPVGISTRSNLLKFINNNISGPSYLTASFGVKPGTDAGLNVTENGNTYTAVNNGGVWYLIPSAAATGGNYALQLYFNGFTGLADNQFGILRRPDASSNAADWSVPTGSSLEPLNGSGRKVSDGFARRINISDFSQLGIGQFTAGPPAECSITGADQVCVSSTGNVYSGPAGQTSYFWTIGGDGFIVGANNTQSITVNAGSAAPATFTLTLHTTLNESSAQCSKTVTVSSTPVCNITGSDAVCLGSQNNIYSGPANMNTYSWTISGGIIVGSATGQTVNVTANSPGSFTLTLDATANNCTSHCSKTVTVNPHPSCSITGSSSVPEGSTGNNYTAPSGMSGYAWSVSGNGTIVGAKDGSSVNVTAGSAGSFTLTLITMLNGCSSTCTKDVTVSPATSADCTITGTAEVCANSTNNIYNGPASMSSYAWSISGNGTIVGATNNSSVTVTAGAAGSFTLTLTTTLNGASGQCMKTVIVKSLPPCSITGSSTVTAATAGNIYSAPATMSSYSWSITGNGSIVGSATNQTVSVTAGAVGSYTLTLITTLNGCSSTCTKDVTVSPATSPNCAITGIAEVCSGSANNIYNGPASMSSYAWSISGNGTIVGATNNSSVNVTAGAAGSFILTLTTTLNEGTAQCTKTVTVKPRPDCSITGSSVVTTGTTGNIYSAPQNMDGYSWSIIGNGSIAGSNTGQTVSVTAGASGTYTVTLTVTSNGCSSTCNKTVTVSPATTLECNVTGTAELCTHSPGNIYSAPAGMSTYSWSVSGNGTITSSTSNQSVTVTAGNAGTFTLTLNTTLNGISCTHTKTVAVEECVGACSYTQGFYGNVKGLACLNNSGTSVNASQLMLIAFGAATSEVFGNAANHRFFTLFKSDITSGNIYKMLPGGGNAKPIDVDNTIPYNGASYAEVSSWKLIPMQLNGPQTGKIRNSLLAQTMTLWFNIGNSASLGSISLVNDTLITRATANCGSNIPVGDSAKFGLPHAVVVYLNGNNGYSPSVNGLFALANDVLGGVNTTVTASDVEQAVDVINNAFENCRILVGTLPYGSLLVTRKVPANQSLNVLAYPNPYTSRFNLAINSPAGGMATIEFFTITGSRVYEMKRMVSAGVTTTVLYDGPVRFGTLLYKVSVAKYSARGIVIKPN